MRKKRLDTRQEKKPAQIEETSGQLSKKRPRPVQNHVQALVSSLTRKHMTTTCVGLASSTETAAHSSPTSSAFVAGAASTEGKKERERLHVLIIHMTLAHPHAKMCAHVCAYVRA